MKFFTPIKKVKINYSYQRPDMSKYYKYHINKIIAL